MLTLSKIFWRQHEFYEQDFLFDVISELIFFILQDASSNDEHQNFD